MNWGMIFGYLIFGGMGLFILLGLIQLIYRLIKKPWENREDMGE